MSSLAVTGHRELRSPGPIREAARDLLGRLRPQMTWSMLASGADQMIAEEALFGGSQLGAVLPFDRYEDDFDGGDLTRYRHLLSHCTEIVRLVYTSESDRAYEQAGRAIVDRGDLVVAVWDGEAADGKGGTGDIVTYALALGRALWWIDARSAEVRLIHGAADVERRNMEGSPGPGPDRNE